MAEQEAQAVGVLQATPFVDLLVHALDHRLTGTLVLEEPGGMRHGVYFEAGTPRKAKTAGAVAPLGQVLVQTGAISEDVHRSTLTRALEEHLLHGQVLLAEGLISEQALGLALREQLLKQMLWLFDRPGDTRFGYFDGANFLEHWGAAPSGRISVMELIWRGLRDHARPAEIDAVVARLGDRVLELREDMPIDYFYFMGEDRSIVEKVRDRPQRLSELRAGAPGLETVIQRVLCLLVLTRSIDLGVRSAPPLGVETNTDATPWSIPPASRTPSIPPLFEPRGAVEDSVVSTPIPVDEPEIDEEPSLELELELPLRAEPEPGPRLASNPETHEEQARDERRAEAAQAFRRAEALLALGHFAKAAEQARVALDNEPGQAEHVALSAWLEALKPDADVQKVTVDLQRALRLAENNVTVHWYRGLVLQRLGRHAGALKEFRWVLEREPRHLDAARQVHVYEVRLESGPPGRKSLAPGPPAESFGWFRRRR